MKSQINILVVGNDPKIIKSAWHALNPEGFNVEGALSRTDAMFRLSQNNYALVFVDLSMTDTDALALIKELKQLRPDMDIVAITDYLDEGLIKEAHRIGIVSHIRKPFTPQVINGVTYMSIERTRGNTPEEEFPHHMLAELDEAIHQYRDQPGHTIQLLLQAQEIFGYLPHVIQKRIARGMNLYPSEVFSIVSFYPYFRTKPGAAYIPLTLGGREKIWRDVTWKNGSRAINAVNEFIKSRQMEYQ